MSDLTIDTTVLAYALFPPRRRNKDAIYEGQFRLHAIAKPIMLQVENKESVMNIPSIAVVEIAAVGARLTGKEERGIQASDYAKEHGNIIYDVSFLSEAAKIAAQTKSSGFDSVFIACAKITNSMLITDDRKMHEAAAKVGVKSKLLREMTV